MAERSILAAVSGIDANQTYLDAVANNIANADTVGYKSEGIQFQDLLSEQISGGAAPPTSGGSGVNPLSVGSGVRVAANSVDLSEGSLESTGQSNDLAIKGNGFLVAVQDGVTGYTRDGSLRVDANGNLSTLGGGLVQGWQANGAGAIDTNAPVSGIQIPSGESIPAQATSVFGLTGNLPAWNGVGTSPSESVTYDAYDSLGDTIPVTLTFTGVTNTANEWSVSGTVPKKDGSGTEALWTTAPTITFDPASGGVASVKIGATAVSANADGSYSIPVSTMPADYGFPGGDTWKFNLPSPSAAGAVTQFAGADTIGFDSQDGHASGSLESYAIGTDGVVVGSFSNGTTLDLGQIALAVFANPAGLTQSGDGTFLVSANSGQAALGTAATGGRGELLGGELEQSNVNLGTELTNLINAQESYDANTKVLTTTQAVMQALESVA